MTTRFSRFRSRQSSARRRSREPNRLRIETLEARQMLAADMLLAGEVLDQELDAPSDDVSVTSLSAIMKSIHDTAKAGMQMSTDGTDAGAETFKSQYDTGGPGYSPNWIGDNASIDGAEAGTETPLEPGATDRVFELAEDHNATGSPTAGSEGVVDAAADTVWRGNLGATTASASPGSFSVPGGDANEPAEDVSFNSHDGANISLEAPVGTVLVDQVFELDDVTVAGNLGMSLTADTLEDNEGDTGDGTVDTQSSIDAGTDGFPDEILNTAPGAETTGPDDTGIQFGILDWLFGMDYDDVETRDDLPDLRKPSYDTYSLARKNKKSHEAACKDAGVEADGKWGKIFKRVYENDNGK